MDKLPSRSKHGFIYLPLPEAAKSISGERSYRRAMEALEVFPDFKERVEEAAYEHLGFPVLQTVDCDHLREEFRILKAMLTEEKQSEAGKQSQNLKRGKTKAPTASGKKSSVPRRKKT